MTINHILIVMLTGVMGTFILSLFMTVVLRNLQPTDFKGYAAVAVMDWLFSLPDGLPNPPNANVADGIYKSTV